MIAFNEQVYTIVRCIPRGRVMAYGAIARVLGEPRRAREVGWAMHQCPPDVPAHRVVNRLGAVSGDREGWAESRRAELEAEGVRFDLNGRCDLEVYAWTPSDEEIDAALTGGERSCIA